MSEAWDDLSLIEPLAGESPCGPGLDASELLAFDAFRIFGQQVALDAPLEPAEGGREGERRRVPKPANSPEWAELRDRSLEALTRSKDLRVLAYFGAAVLRTDGPAALCRVIAVASTWLSGFWDTVHPLATDDSLERQSALSAFTDHFAFVEPLRKAVLVSSRQHGRFSLRDIQNGSVRQAVEGAFDEMPLTDLQCFCQRVLQAHVALQQMESQIKATDTDPVLTFKVLAEVLEQLHRLLSGQVARRTNSGGAVDGAVTADGGVAAANGASARVTAGTIGTRADAIRALDAVAAFFRQTEPSSPVPLLLDRAKRLVDKSFLEVLADIAPGALGEARSVSGVKDQ
jgi:type VI secretion system protein ImpA